MATAHGEKSSMTLNDIKDYPLFVDQELESIQLLEQQGHANTIYLVQSKRKKYLLRRFKISINRQMEYRVQLRAYAYKIGAKPLVLDRKKGLMISEFIEGVHQSKLTQRQLKQMAHLLKKLHKIKIRQKQNSFKNNFSFKNKKVKRAFILLSKEKKEYALGHNDLHPQNILFTKRGIRLIDWEYARNSDIYFDLVSIMIEYKLNRHECKIFLHNYFQGKSVNQKKIKAFTIIYKELWDLWFKKLAKGEL